MTMTWYRCPNCGHANPDCFDEENAETLAWQPDQVPCDTCGEHAVVLCPHCHRDYDPLTADRLPVAPHSSPEPSIARTPERHAQTWPPAAWRQ